MNFLYANLKQAHIEWQKEGLLGNPNYYRSDGIISWMNNSRSFLPNSPTYKDLILLAENRQYSLQFRDGSIVQIYYEYDRKEFRAASLSYVFAIGSANPNLEEDSEWDGSETKEEETSVQWLRIDYDPSCSASVVHAQSHLHSSLHPEMRIGLDGVPTPSQFIEMLIAWFHPEAYRSTRLNDGGKYKDFEKARLINSLRLECSSLADVFNVVHMRIPKHES